MDENSALRALCMRDERALGWFIDRYTAYVATIVNNMLLPRLGVRRRGGRCGRVPRALAQRREHPQRRRAKEQALPKLFGQFCSFQQNRHKKIPPDKREGFVWKSKKAQTAPACKRQRSRRFPLNSNTKQSASSALPNPLRLVCVRFSRYTYRQSTFSFLLRASAPWVLQAIMPHLF